MVRPTPDSSSNPSETRGFASFRCQANSSIPQTTMGRASKCSKSSKSAPAASKSWASCTMRPQLGLDTFKPFINLNPNDCFGPHLVRRTPHSSSNPSETRGFASSRCQANSSNPQTTMGRASKCSESSRIVEIGACGEQKLGQLCHAALAGA